MQITKLNGKIYDIERRKEANKVRANAEKRFDYKINEEMTQNLENYRLLH